MNILRKTFPLSLYRIFAGNTVMILLSGMIFLPFPAHSQSDSGHNRVAEPEDVIYLKNGGVLRGKILDIGGNQAVKIEITGRNVFIVQLNDIEKIEKEIRPVPAYYKTSGYINHTGIEILSGRGNTTVHFYMMNGYRLNPRFAAGIGIGYIPYRDPLDMVPLYLEFLVNLTKSNVSPFLFLKSGYNFTIHSDQEIPIEDHSGGWMFNPGIGLQFNLEGGFRWYLNAGYNVNNARFEEEWGNGTIDNDLSYRRVMFGLGFAF